MCSFTIRYNQTCTLNCVHSLNYVCKQVLEEVKRSAEELKHVGFELALCSDLQLQFGGLQLIEHGIW